MRRGALYQGLWNLDLSDLDCLRALSDVELHEFERSFGLGALTSHQIVWPPKRHEATAFL